MDANKFLNDDNIIKKEDLVEEEIDLGLGDTEEQSIDYVEEIVEEVPKKKPRKKRTVPKKENVKEEVKKSPIKTEQEIIAEMLNRMKEQKISKEIDLEMHHYLYNNGGSNKERERCELIIKNLAEEIRSVSKKIEFLENRFKKGDK